LISLAGLIPTPGIGDDDATVGDSCFCCRDFRNTEPPPEMIKSRRIRWAGHITCMGDKRNAYRILVREPEGKRPLGRPRRRWEDNIKTDLREIGWGGID
jgi:hypothetical protein